MEIILKGKVERERARHAAGVSQQTGFPSPATHYREPSINLHQELIANGDATFFIRVEGDGLEQFNMYHNDVLIVDRSIAPSSNLIAVVVKQGGFKVMRIPEEGLSETLIYWGCVTYTIHRAR